MTLAVALEATEAAVVVAGGAGAGADGAAG